MSEVFECIDVSRYQAELDTAAEWRQVRAAGVRVAIVKATEGLTYRSPAYESQANAAHEAGLVVGAYHFLRLGDGLAQARYFLDFARTRAEISFAMLDLEWPSKWGTVDPRTYTRVAEACAAEVCRHLPLAIYTSRKEANQLLMPGHSLGRFDVLIPGYGSNDGRDHGEPRIPHGWAAGDVWGHQYTSRGQVPGYRGHVDRSHVRSLVPRSWIAPLP